MLHRYWFQFARVLPPDILNTGCGITAYDVDDARKMLDEYVFSVYQSRAVLSVAEDIDISSLEETHVRPNMGNPIIRGIWFPLGLNE